ncbi:MAG: hypothetical protein AAFN74_10470 [Myxococcota bacterium]
MIGASIASTLFTAQPVNAENPDILVGDAIHGQKLYAEHCAKCHDSGRAPALTVADRLIQRRDEALLAAISRGEGLQAPAQHAFERKLSFLSQWDLVAHIRTQHMRLDSFFPAASRYIGKVYTIDQNGLKRIEAATGRRPADTAATVFTFFDVKGERGNLTYVTQDPIELDKLRKDNKAGYLVFVPFEQPGFSGRELGLAMDARGRLIKAAVHDLLPGAEAINRRLKALKGQGHLGQKRPFRVKGPRKTQALARQVFPLYLRAMETVTQYVVEERERTWADDAVR